MINTGEFKKNDMELGVVKDTTGNVGRVYAAREERRHVTLTGEDAD